MDPLALDRQVCFALAAANRSVVALYRPVLEPLGLTHPQYLVMLALWERSPRTASEIATRLAMDPATITPILKRLEQQGLLERRRAVHDERVLQISLTDAGTALRTRALAVPGTVLDRLGMSLEQLEQIRDGLTELLQASQRARAVAAAGAMEPGSRSSTASARDVAS